MYKIGIDVGGTNTDAVLTTLDGEIIAKIKTNTSKNIIDGIYDVIQQIVSSVDIDLSEIKYAMLGTTQCTNAILQRKELEKTIVIRIAGYATDGVMPAYGWPDDIYQEVIHDVYLVDGGYEFDGSRMGEINYEEIDKILKDNPGFKNYAISCVNSPTNDEDEISLRKYINSKVDNASISISSEIGTYSLLERENATILNSSLVSVIDKVVNSFKQALDKNNLGHVSFYLCQNDGTIMKLENALKYPILTISSGPTNSIRGAVTLADVDNAIIVDVGGTTTDIGVLDKGLARESHGTTDIGGVNTNFRMPDMISLAIGGGTIVDINNLDNIKVGPESVGHQLVNKSLVFGGDTLTLTDIAVRLRRADIGDMDKVKHISLDIAKKVDAIVNEKINNAIDLLKLSDKKANVIFVGGGCVVINQDVFKKDNIIIPQNYSVANAIGASIAQVSGYYEAIYQLANEELEDCVNDANKKAIKNTLKAGGVESSIKIVDFEQNQLNYYPGNAFVFKVKAIGDLKH